MQNFQAYTADTQNDQDASRGVVNGMLAGAAIWLLILLWVAF